jgi:hypothetical protein
MLKVVRLDHLLNRPTTFRKRLDLRCAQTHIGGPKQQVCNLALAIGLDLEGFGPWPDVTHTQPRIGVIGA